MDDRQKAMEKMMDDRQKATEKMMDDLQRRFEEQLESATKKIDYLENQLKVRVYDLNESSK